MSAIERAADLLIRWSHEVDPTHAAPGAVETMREIGAAVKAELAELERRSGELERLAKAWAARELDALPRGPWREWHTSGSLPRALEPLLSSLPALVAVLVREHFADEMGVCEVCARRAPCRLRGGEAGDLGECRWRCAWDCPPPTPDETADALRAWAKERGL